MSKISRCEFISKTSLLSASLVCVPLQALFNTSKENHNKMYGLIGKIRTKQGHRDELIDILLEGIADIPGCLSYIISKVSEDEDVIWITEVWKTKESHKESLELPSIQKAIKQGRPLISEFTEQIEMEPVGGHGLVSTENK